jgi:hypothetical protein
MTTMTTISLVLELFNSKILNLPDGQAGSKFFIHNLSAVAEQ